MVGHHAYVTCTAHFVSKSWVMHHFPLGIFEKKGRSRAEDKVAATVGILSNYDLSYTNLVRLPSITRSYESSKGVGY
jgi:hypothetical protein